MKWSIEMDDLKWYFILVIFIFTIAMLSDYFRREQEIRKMEIQAKIEAKESGK